MEDTKANLHLLLLLNPAEDTNQLRPTYSEEAEVDTTSRRRQSEEVTEEVLLPPFRLLSQSSPSHLPLAEEEDMTSHPVILRAENHMVVEEEEDTKSKAAAVAADTSPHLLLHLHLAAVTAEQAEATENQLLRQPEVTAMTAKAEDTDRLFQFQSIRQVEEEEEDTDHPLHHLLPIVAAAAVALVTDHLHPSRHQPEAMAEEAQHLLLLHLAAEEVTVDRRLAEDTDLHHHHHPHLVAAMEAEAHQADHTAADQHLHLLHLAAEVTADRRLQAEGTKHLPLHHLHLAADMEVDQVDMAEVDRHLLLVLLLLLVRNQHLLLHLAAATDRLLLLNNNNKFLPTAEAVTDKVEAKAEAEDLPAVAAEEVVVTDQHLLLLPLLNHLAEVTEAASDRFRVLREADTVAEVIAAAEAEAVVTDHLLLLVLHLNQHLLLLTAAEVEAEDTAAHHRHLVEAMAEADPLLLLVHHLLLNLPHLAEVMAAEVTAAVEAEAVAMDQLLLLVLPAEEVHTAVDKTKVEADTAEDLLLLLLLLPPVQHLNHQADPDTAEVALVQAEDTAEDLLLLLLLHLDHNNPLLPTAEVEADMEAGNRQQQLHLAVVEDMEVEAAEDTAKAKDRHLPLVHQQVDTEDPSSSNSNREATGVELAEEAEEAVTAKAKEVRPAEGEDMAEVDLLLDRLLRLDTEAEVAEEVAEVVTNQLLAQFPSRQVEAEEEDMDREDPVLSHRFNPAEADPVKEVELEVMELLLLVRNRPHPVAAMAEEAEEEDTAAGDRPAEVVDTDPLLLLLDLNRPHPAVTAKAVAAEAMGDLPAAAEEAVYTDQFFLLLGLLHPAAEAVTDKVEAKAEAEAMEDLPVVVTDQHLLLLDRFHPAEGEAAVTGDRLAEAAVTEVQVPEDTALRLRPQLSSSSSNNQRHHTVISIHLFLSKINFKFSNYQQEEVEVVRPSSSPAVGATGPSRPQPSATND